MPQKTTVDIQQEYIMPHTFLIFLNILSIF